jgi:hypothetical protein
MGTVTACAQENQLDTIHSMFGMQSDSVVAVLEAECPGTGNRGFVAIAQSGTGAQR